LAKDNSCGSRRQAGAQTLGQAEQGFLVVDDAAAIGGRHDGEFLVAEEGEVVIQQPVQVDLDFIQLGLVHLELGAIQPGQQLARLGLHRLEVGDAHAHVAEDFVNGPFKRLQLGGTGAAVDFQEHQRFLQHALALGATRENFQQLAILVAAHAEHAVLQGVDAVTMAIELHAHRVDQERDVAMQDFHRRVGGLPAVLLVIGVEGAHLRLGVIELLQHVPGRQGAADQVGQTPLGQLLEGDDAEELFGE